MNEGVLRKKDDEKGYETHVLHYFNPTLTDSRHNESSKRNPEDGDKESKRIKILWVSTYMMSLVKLYQVPCSQRGTTCLKNQETGVSTYFS